MIKKSKRTAFILNRNVCINIISTYNCNNNNSIDPKLFNVIEHIEHILTFVNHSTDLQ